MNLINLATKYTINWIRTVGRYHFDNAQTVEELKKLVSQRLFGLQAPNERQIKGLKLVNWEAVLKAIPMICFIFLVGQVHATSVTIKYTITQKSAGRSLVISSPKTKKGDTSAGGLSKKTQNISISGDSRGVKSQTAVPSEKKTERKIEASQSQESTRTHGGIEPFKKYLTEQGVRTRETVMRIAEQVYSDQDLVAFDNILKKESGYRYDAINEIGACGMGQALPCEKMGCPLTEEGVNCQTEWIMNYVSRRYGTPTNAWNFHLINNWY